jgi:hypothetical protein
MPSDDFLRIVISLQNEIDPSSFTQLFVRLCTYTKIDDLEVSATMVRNAVEFLIDLKNDDKAAHGLLRLIYQNSITLTVFPVATLIKF